MPSDLELHVEDMCLSDDGLITPLDIIEVLALMDEERLAEEEKEQENKND